ncbi:hypothetical protein M758_N007300 [Ceratodon purpureus]|nr:hypothetical protein M758_N007300 [Ceratodon purpureus]
MAYVHTDPPGSSECVLEPDPGPSQVEKTEMEMGSSHEKISAERGGLATISAGRSDEASQLGDGASDERLPLAEEKHSDGRTKVGKGLESIGDLTADALQRLASAVGSVAKAPVALMASAGGLGSNANSPTSTCGTPLAERVGHLETQMAMLDEKYISKALATELIMSPRSHPTTPRSMEKLRTARSLLQETEEKGTLVERVQALEDRLAEYMERYDKDLSSIQSKLAHINTGKLKSESLAIQDSGELSPSGDEFHDADQLSVNLEPLEQNFFEESDLGSDVHDEVRGTSLTPQEAPVEEPLAKAPTAEPAAEDGADERGTLFPPSDPQLGSSSEEPRNAFVKEPSPAAPSAQFSESAGKGVSEKSDIAIAAEEDSSFSSVEDKPKETLVKEPTTAASTVDLPEPEQGGDGGKSHAVVSFSDPQSISTLEEPQGGLATEPSIAEASAKAEEPAVKEGAAADRTGSELAGAESALTSTVDVSDSQGSLVKEPLLPEASAELEGPSAHENADAVDKTGSVPAGAQSLLTSAVKEPQTDAVGATTEDKHVQREYQYKAAEDARALEERPGSFTSFMKEPKPSGRKEKKKKEKKEKRQDGFTEEKGRTNSLRAEGKRDDAVLDVKGIRTNSLRSEEKSKQPFKHLRDRFRRAFKSNKDP